MRTPTRITDMRSVMVSNGWKSRSRGTSYTHPMTMHSGTTNRAICVAEPTAIPSESSILFLWAKMIAAACSAALPTMGITIVPRKSSGTPYSAAAPSMASTIHSESTEMKKVITASQKIAPHTPRIRSSSSSLSLSSKICVCVYSWNTRNRQYVASIMTETARETSRPEVWLSASLVTSSTIGMAMHITARRSSPKLAVCAVLLNFCSGCLRPPTRNAVPRTRRMLERIEPSRLTCTMRSKPAFKAKSETMSSVTLPNVAFSSPPSVSEV
mmetsp:Transcript_39120/g.103059  ORF Transcript_39120/g.103059 Transcript_39120/m.103059 type:complete len:270 (-) Transcript_39120:456-1265(-)